MLRSRKAFNLQNLPSDSSSSFSNLIVNTDKLDFNVSHICSMSTSNTTVPVHSLDQTTSYVPLDDSNINSDQSAELDKPQDIPMQNSKLASVNYGTLIDKGVVSMSELITSSCPRLCFDFKLNKSKDHPTQAMPAQSQVDAITNDAQVEIKYPKVKVKEDILVLDEESITMVPKREQIHHDTNLIYESSVDNANTCLRHKSSYKVQRWSQIDTNMFFQSLSQYGTDFTIIQQNAFPQRSRIEIKNKFKREEKNHPKRINNALKRKIPIMDFLTREEISDTNDLTTL